MQRLKTVLPNLPDDKILELLNLEEIKDDLEEMPPAQYPSQIPQGVPNASPTSSSKKPFSQITEIGASREIDSELITQAINAKKLNVLDKIEDMIKNAEKDTKKNKNSN